ncbi:hypothetical protein [Mammaliicoccus sciuri]|uniref:hypothetical protein n=1 Tax=Mammaliicoccus sciuri TaxID=1296 RepID=UPI001E2D6B29|nr:hypothetical protein [Mammaliicoccus sciuri]MCD8799114.1 hypothetical protein [Mammaliicoccus sciuri]
MYNIPVYTRSEIVQLIKYKILENDNFNEKLNISNEKLDKLLSLKSIWTPVEYQLAAEITGIEIEKLMANLPQEDLNNISFRALENNDLINNKVHQLNEIFEDLTYQLKIGSDIHG